MRHGMMCTFTVLSRLPKHVQISDLKGQIYELQNKSARKQVRLEFIAHLVPLVTYFRNNLSCYKSHLFFMEINQHHCLILLGRVPQPMRVNSVQV